jgi:hypothetical protein
MRDWRTITSPPALPVMPWLWSFCAKIGLSSGQCFTYAQGLVAKATTLEWCCTNPGCTEWGGTTVVQRVEPESRARACTSALRAGVRVTLLACFLDRLKRDDAVNFELFCVVRDCLGMEILPPNGGASSAQQLC